MTVFRMGIIYCERYTSDARVPVGMNKYVFCFGSIEGHRQFSIFNMSKDGHEKSLAIKVSFRKLFDYAQRANFYTRFHISSTRFESE